MAPVSKSGVPALEVKHLSVAFGGRTILRDLSFAVQPGRVLAVVGPNGAGKTVLFQALVGMVPFSGEVTWAPGTRLGYVPQKLDLERDLPLTGLDLLGAKARVVGAPLKDVEGALTEVGLTQRNATQPVGALSGGQFQRLMFALALLGGPTVLLLDELTAGIDEPGQEQAWSLLDQVVKERRETVLLISHELSVVFHHATEVLCLGGGRAWFGAPKEVLTRETLAELYGSSLLHLHDHDLA